MKRIASCSQIASALLTAMACTTGARAEAPATVLGAPIAPAACDSLSGFFLTNCPLTWYGVTLYGTVDIGADWISHSVGFNASGQAGIEYLLQRNSNRSGFHFAPNEMSQSNIGLKADMALVPDWHFVADFEFGFDPYSMRLADGPGTLRQNAGVPLADQTTASDSSRAGEAYNSVGYFGISSPTYGTLTLFRQNALTLDGVIAYDPLGGSYAFSPIGYSGTTCGMGDTEDCRFTTAVKYRVNYGPVRAAMLHQFGGYGLNNAADGAWQFQLGGNLEDVAGGTISLDGIYSRVKDAVGLSLTGAAGPPGPFQTLTATISDDTSWMALARYSGGPVKLYGGYEWIDYANPSDPKKSFNDISGDLICAGCIAINNTTINNTAFRAHDKVLQIFWVGGRYAIAPQWTLMGGYYEYLQNDFGAGASCGTNVKSTCSGIYNAVSIAVDYQFAAKFDAYAGIMHQMAGGGLANGFLHHDTIDPGFGARFRF